MTRADRALVRAILATFGTEDEIQTESQLDVLTGLSGSGAAYPALMAAAMLAQARVRGLPEQVARRAVEAVVCDGADLLRGRIGTAPELLDAYRGYRGTTAAGLDAAEALGFSRAIREALEAATIKAGRM